MDQSLATRLAAIPRLDRANAAGAAIPCKLCGWPAQFFDLVDFNKCGSSGHGFGPSGIAVSYHRCTACGFLFTTFCDDWTPDDFHRFVYNDDYWQVDVEHRSTRPRRIADQMQRVLAPFKACRILDYGAGEGLFAQHMRDAGFSNIFGYDPFLMPRRPEGRFDLITCFEVLEHTPSPLRTLIDMRSLLVDDGYSRRTSTSFDAAGGIARRATAISACSLIGPWHFWARVPVSFTIVAACRTCFVPRATGGSRISLAHWRLSSRP